MKLGEAIPNYQAYRNELQDKKTSIYKQYKKTKEKAERTNDEEWIQKAAELELSYKEATDDFDKYENVLNSLREQWCAAANTENNNRNFQRRGSHGKISAECGALRQRPERFETTI